MRLMLVFVDSGQGKMAHISNSSRGSMACCRKEYYIKRTTKVSLPSDRLKCFKFKNLDYTAPNPFQSEDSYNKYYDVPHNVSSFFTGRDVISSMLHSKCLPTQPATMQKEQNRFVLHGLGGVGKTQVCLNFAQSHQERYLHYFCTCRMLHL